ncbi:hypothetical protein PR048_028522 [Dryococelus australis]|uniref:Tc1-like transposase DDE domain-containing protein n=1 Tax=Dryococelus australis TaxID=614101 RepID=A0ABQ9GDC9_9NEOP|nr:hypothetical protein PR048_028522 [Dryococelus australis]
MSAGNPQCDETRFYLGDNDQHVPVWRQRGARQDEDAVTPHTSRRPDDMARGAMSTQPDSNQWETTDPQRYLTTLINGRDSCHERDVFGNVEWWGGRFFAPKWVALVERDDGNIGLEVLWKGVKTSGARPFSANRMLLKRCDFGAAPECMGIGNRASPRNKAEQGNRPAQFPREKIQEQTRWEAYPVCLVDLCFTAFGVGSLVFVRGSMNTEAYCNILDNGMPPTLWCFYEMDPCYFQDDNARCHVSRATMQWYADNNVRRLDWPAQSPDFNPIEHLWDEMDRRVRARQMRPKSIAQLMEWLQEEWGQIPVDVLQTLVESMPDRTNSQCDKRTEDPPRRGRCAKPRPRTYMSTTSPLSYGGRESFALPRQLENRENIQLVVSYRNLSTTAAPSASKADTGAVSQVVVSTPGDANTLEERSLTTRILTSHSANKSSYTHENRERRLCAGHPPGCSSLTREAGSFVETTFRGRAGPNVTAPLGEGEYAGGICGPPPPPQQHSNTRPQNNSDQRPTLERRLCAGHPPGCSSLTREAGSFVETTFRGRAGPNVTAPLGRGSMPGESVDPPPPPPAALQYPAAKQFGPTTNFEPIRVIDVSMEPCRNGRAGETGVPRENPPTNGIVQHDSHIQESGVTCGGLNQIA